MHRMIVGKTQVVVEDLGMTLQRAHHEVTCGEQLQKNDTWTDRIAKWRVLWAGQVAKMESSRPAKHIQLWLGSAWVKQQESVLGRGRQGHRRHLHVRRWESWMSRWRPGCTSGTMSHISHCWIDHTQNLLTWNEHADPHTTWTQSWSPFSEK